MPLPLLLVRLTLRLRRSAARTLRLRNLGVRKELVRTDAKCGRKFDDRVEARRRPPLFPVLNRVNGNAGALGEIGLRQTGRLAEASQCGAKAHWEIPFPVGR